MKKRVVQALGCILAMTMVVGSLTACGGKSEKKAEKKAGSDVKVAIICSAAGQNDNGYNQSAVEGAKKAADEFGIEYKVVEPTTGVPQALESLADDGYNVIFNLEYDFEALIQGTGGAQPIAEMYPDTTFVCVNDNPNQDEDGNTIHDNVKDGSICYVREDGKIRKEEIGICQVEQVVDATGSGDAYMAGFVYGYLHGYSPADCCRLGSVLSYFVLQAEGCCTNAPTEQELLQKFETLR